MLTNAFGFLEEQGIESIHPNFNTLARTYNSVRQAEQKLLLMLLLQKEK